MTFLPENKTVEFKSGELPYRDHGKRGSLLDIALNFNIHLEHACGGSCACTTCHVIVVEGDKTCPKRKMTNWIGSTWPLVLLCAPA